MNSRAITRFSKPTFYQVILCIISLLYYLASSQEELEWCGDMFQCGNITAGFPFWGGKRPDNCGHTLLELHCSTNNTTSLIISDQEYNVLGVDQTSYTLTLARTDLLGPFCSAKFNTTTLPPDIFDLSPTTRNLTVSYLCDPLYPDLPSNFTCLHKGNGSVSLGPGRPAFCNESFTVNVPMDFFPKEREFNLNQLESVLREGFEVKVEIDEITCQECLSSGGICSFNGTTQVCCKTNSPSGVSCEPKSQRSATELHDLCNTRFICGDHRLFYPFWIPGREECGHPDFRLTCIGGLAEVNIASVKFRILEANYTTRIIRLGRSDYIGHLCPQNPSHALLDQKFSLFSPDTELLAIYYGCGDFSFSTPFYDPTYFRELGCYEEVGKGYYVTRNLSSHLLDGVRDLLSALRGLCSNVSILASGPALRTLQRFQTSDNLKKVIQEGFELGVNRECYVCMDSRGACGYNQTTRRFVCYCKNGPHSHTCSSRKRNHETITKILIGSSVLVAGVLVVILTLILRKRKLLHGNGKQNLKTLIPLKHYSYAQVKRITKSFEEVVGEGGFGTVYKGSLSDGSMVAVKVLKDSKCNGEDFVNEVVSMSRTSHVNIVSLLGFCSEGSKRAIVYELLENGSLDRFISTNNSMSMDWMAMHGIALGVARGLEYLHYGCKTRIVHFDIKPQNVLLDEDLCPKVSDFGLAKLCKRKESTMSLLEMRGTIGYIAPEMISRVYGSVSHKSDVYSYGMLVLEMIGARNKTFSESNTSSMYFPEWIYKDLEKGDDERLVGNVISKEEAGIAKKMTLVGLWCIQSSPSDRPPMNRVVEMMEGSLDSLIVPPKPVWQIPTVPLSETSWISEESSNITN